MANQQNGRGGREDDGAGKPARKSAQDQPQSGGESEAQGGQRAESGARKGASDPSSARQDHDQRTPQTLGERKAGQSGDVDDLKSREYTSPDGEIRHHTKAYMDQHKGDAQKGGENQKGGDGQGQRG